MVFDFSTSEGIKTLHAINAELVKRVKQDRNRQEMLEYLSNIINSEFGGNSTDDAINNWEAFKIRHGIET